VGNARTAIFDWLLARSRDGVFVLRLEDTDAARTVPGAVENILESLRWLGLQWDEGPEVGGPYGPYIQSQRRHIYQSAVQQLLEAGQAYECFCSAERLQALREEQRARKQPTGYDRHCRRLSAEERARRRAQQPFVIRFAVPEQGETVFEDRLRGRIAFQHREMDDFVLIKSDGMPVYHFANVVDDHLMEITHVLRGEEWISSTPKHVLLYQAFGWEPPVFVHLPLILAPDRSRLSKRHGATSLLEYRDQGFLPQAMVNFLSLLGWSPGGDQEFLSVEEIVERFSLENVSATPAIFDRDKLEWLNAQHLRRLSLPDLSAALRPFLRQQPGVEARLLNDQAYVERVVELVRERGRTLVEVAEGARFFFAAPAEYDREGVAKWFDRPGAADLLRGLSAALGTVEPFDAPTIESRVRGYAEGQGLTPATAIHTARLALTRKTVGPGLFELMAVLGREECRQRLEAAAERADEEAQG